jgi:hypothetical protein
MTMNGHRIMQHTLEVKSPGKPYFNEDPAQLYTRSIFSGDEMINDFFKFLDANWIHTAGIEGYADITVLVDGEPVLEMTNGKRLWRPTPQT